MARGPLVDLAWRPPEFDEAERHLVGYELFRDDMSTRPSTRRTWKTMPLDVVEARGLENLPNSEFGVQPIWRLYAPQPPYPIEFGPPRLPNDGGIDPQVVLPSEERIHALAWLQRDGLISSEELELAVDQLLGRNAPVLPIPEPVPQGAVPRAPNVPLARAKATRTLVAYIAVAVVLILAAVVGAPLVGSILFGHPAAVRIVPSAPPSPTPATPSPSPVPTARQLNLRSILIQPADLLTGYVAGPFDATPLCPSCVPASYSLSVTLMNSKLNRSITTGTSVAPSAADSKTVLQALMTSLSAGGWVAGKGLGDESHTHSATQSGKTFFYVVWRSGVVTNEVVLAALKGTRTLQNAIDLAKIQQARTVVAHA
jgi:hypothetical protein